MLNRQFFMKLVGGILLLLMISVVAEPFISKMLRNFERTAVNQVVGQLRAAVNLKLAEYVALDKLQELSEHVDENPMSWLDIDDLGGYNHYLGEVDSLAFEKLDTKQWVFDRSVKRLIYKVKYPELLNNDDPISNRIQFQLVLNYSDLNEDKQFSADIDKITGLMIVPVYSYSWLQSNKSNKNN